MAVTAAATVASGLSSLAGIAVDNFAATELEFAMAVAAEDAHSFAKRCCLAVNSSNSTAIKFAEESWASN